MLLFVFMWPSTLGRQGLSQEQQPKSHEAQEKTTNKGKQKNSPANSETFKSSAHEHIEAQRYYSQPKPEKEESRRNSEIWMLGKPIASDWVMVGLTFVIAFLTLLYVGVTYWQVKTAHTINRAWIIINPSDSNPGLAITSEKQAGPIYINIFDASFKNVGNTPAHLLEMALNYITVDSLENLPPRPRHGNPQNVEGIMLVPQDSIGIRKPLAPHSSLTDKDALTIQNAEKFLIAFGYVSYKDVFGKRHETHCSYVYDFPQGLNISIYKPRFQRFKSSEDNKAT
jgi:hypothetical protein